MASEILGVDIGGVIISRTPIGDFYPPIPEVFTVLKRLKNERFGNNIFVVSHADSYMGRVILSWLLRNNFYQATGIPTKNVHFCFERIDKAEVCLNIGVTHFIDDRSEVLAYLHNANIKNLYLFQGRQDEVRYYMHILPFVTQVESWDEIALKLLD